MSQDNIYCSSEILKAEWRVALPRSASIPYHTCSVALSDQKELDQFVYVTSVDVGSESKSGGSTRLSLDVSAR